MIAARALRYAGRPVAAGAEFSVKGERDARILRAVGSAALAPPPEALKPVAARPATARRTYRRRDMVAETAGAALEATPAAAGGDAGRVAKADADAPAPTAEPAAPTTDAARTADIFAAPQD